MIQLNLLPDVKTKYIKAQRSKRLVLVSSVAISGVALGIVVLLSGIVFVAQKGLLSHYESEIKKNTAELQAIDGLSKILTVQNQLSKINGLHADKPVTSRLFNFIQSVTPSSVQIGTLQLSYDAGTMNITGTANSIEDVNKFVDTLKFTKFTTENNTTEQNAFSSVVLSSFTIGDDKKSSYSVTLAYKPELFSGANKNVTLIVPKITSTRSETERPNSLFNKTENQQSESLQ